MLAFDALMPQLLSIGPVWPSTLTLDQIKTMRYEGEFELYMAWNFFHPMAQMLIEDGKILSYKHVWRDCRDHTLRRVEVTLPNGKVCKVTDSKKLAQGMAKIQQGWTPSKQASERCMERR